MDPESIVRRFHLEWLSTFLEGLDDWLHAVVALVLVGVSAAVLFHVLTRDLVELVHGFATPKHFFEPVLTAVNDTLVVIIVLEVLRTVIAHLRRESFALQRFIIIGIISTVRHLLIVGAHLSLADSVSATEFRQSIIELGLNGVLAFVLVGAYTLLRRVDPADEEPDETPSVRVGNKAR
jgi:uncharacterized membrane protein (DUF373 family)